MGNHKSKLSDEVKQEARNCGVFWVSPMGKLVTEIDGLTEAEAEKRAAEDNARFPEPQHNTFCKLPSPVGRGTPQR